MTHNFSAEEVAEFEDAFELFDRSGEGKIRFAQCADLARCFGYDPLDSHVAIILGPGDDKPVAKEDMATKTLTFTEYLPILWQISQAEITTTFDEYCEAMKVFEKEGSSGTIPVHDVRRAMTALGEKMSDKQVTQLLEGLEDAAGNVNYKKFIEKVLSDVEQNE